MKVQVSRLQMIFLLLVFLLGRLVAVCLYRIDTYISSIGIAICHLLERVFDNSRRIVADTQFQI